MTRESALGNGVAPHFAPENFLVFAQPELEAAPPWTVGVCFNPACQKHFTPTREWQIYCSDACANVAKAEMRRWGHKMALPLLLHRIGKYERRDEAVMARTRAARRYLTQGQSAWLAERRAAAGGGRA